MCCCRRIINVVVVTENLWLSWKTWIKETEKSWNPPANGLTLLNPELRCCLRTEKALKEKKMRLNTSAFRNDRGKAAVKTLLKERGEAVEALVSARWHGCMLIAPSFLLRLEGTAGEKKFPKRMRDFTQAGNRVTWTVALCKPFQSGAQWPSSRTPQHWTGDFSVCLNSGEL